MGSIFLRKGRGYGDFKRGTYGGVLKGTFSLCFLQDVSCMQQITASVSLLFFGFSLNLSQ